jgi:hypothetical protein
MFNDIAQFTVTIFDKTTINESRNAKALLAFYIFFAGEFSNKQ